MYSEATQLGHSKASFVRQQVPMQVQADFHFNSLLRQSTGLT